MRILVKTDSMEVFAALTAATIGADLLEGGLRKVRMDVRRAADNSSANIIEWEMVDRVDAINKV